MTRTDPVALAHPDDVLAVFEHDAVWIGGNAMLVLSDSLQTRGTFLVRLPDGYVRAYEVPQTTAQVEAPSPVLVGGLTPDQCLDRYEALQRDEPAELTSAQLAVARELWSARLRQIGDAT